MSQAGPRHKGNSYADYLAWPSPPRYELIDGEAMAMSPAPGALHQAVSMALSIQIGSFLQNYPCQVFAAPFDVRLPQTSEADEDVQTVVQPDLSVICDPSKLDAKGCCGAPDWIVEILSPATAAHDQIVKRDLYERHGVREYWLVHPRDRLVWVYRLGDDGRYGPAEVSELAGGVASQVVAGLVVEWDRVVGELPV